MSDTAIAAKTPTMTGEDWKKLYSEVEVTMLDPRRLVREPLREALTGITKTSWARYEAEGFVNGVPVPKAILLNRQTGGIAKAWVLGELLNFLEALAATRDSPAA